MSAALEDTAGSAEHMRVAFPATAQFASVGRVAVAGLALRLGFDVVAVEDLRVAVSTAIAALGGPGKVALTASWSDDELHLELENPEAVGVSSESGEPVDYDELAAELADLVTEAGVSASHITLKLTD